MSNVIRETHLGESKWSFVIPEDRVDDDLWVEGLNVLLLSALPSYNASVTALKGGNVPVALEECAKALRVMPYCSELLEYGTAICIQHGAYDYAAGLLSHARDLDVPWDVGAYENILYDRIRRWNEGISNPESLLSHYESPNADSNYRELLFLRERLQGKQEHALRSHFKAFGIELGEARPRRTRSPWATIAIGVGAIALGVAIGVLWPDSVERVPSGEVTAVTPGTEDTAVSGSPDTSPTASEWSVIQGLAESDGAEALRLVADSLGNLPIDRRKSIRVLGTRLVSDDVSSRWEQGDYEGIVTEYGSLHTLDDIQPTVLLYYLGVAASEFGEDQIAFSALSRYLDLGGESALDHYRAQAAYFSAKYAPDAQKARQYAEIVAEDYSETIYNNSLIRQILSDE